MAKRNGRTGDAGRTGPDDGLVLEQLRRHLEILGLTRTLAELDERLVWATRERPGATALLEHVLGIEAAHKLDARGVSAEVVSFHTVKPLDTDFLTEAFAGFKLVATIEEHSLIGGVGAAVSEWSTDHRVSAPAFLRFGTPDAVRWRARR